MPVLVRVENLVKHFPISGSSDKVCAVNGVSLTVNNGETLGLVGESGSGKTTVGRCVLRLEELTAGEVFFDGEAIGSMPLKQLRPKWTRMQMVFQEPFGALNPRFTARSAVEEPLKLLTRLSRTEQIDRVSEVAEMLNLDGSDLDRYPHELSGGQAQKVCIARAMVTSPQFIVHDEPTSFLDPSARAEILALLVRLQDELGLSYLYISHDLTTVRDLASRVAVMYLGQIVEMGNKDDVFDRRLHPYTKALLSAVLLPDPTLERSRYVLQGEIPSPIRLPHGCYLYTRCPMAQPTCANTPQHLVDVGGGHFVACHVVTQVDGRS